jgi:hypothetical protein
MKRLKLTRDRRELFLKVLADTGNVTAAVAAAGTSRTRVYELRKTDIAFAAAWDEAEEIATDRLEGEARRRAIEGVAEPLVSAANSFATMTVNPSRSSVTRIICSWRCSKRAGHRGAKGRCASNCRRFDPLLMQPAQWQRSPPGLPLAS